MKLPYSVFALPVLSFVLFQPAFAAEPQSTVPDQKTRIAIVGLDHDHVWELLKYIANEPQAELVAIANAHPDLVDKAKSQVPASVKFYPNYVKMLDEARPEAVFVTTSNDRHLEILRECAKRHIHYSAEKPMATNAADAREMQRLAEQAGIKLMVNYWNAWAASSHELFHRVKSGDVGPVQKIIVQYGHNGPKEIGVSKEFADWLYDPAKNGGGAIMDFGCYGAEWALWLKGRPTRVYATTRKHHARLSRRYGNYRSLVGLAIRHGSCLCFRSQRKSAGHTQRPDASVTNGRGRASSRWRVDKPECAATRNQQSHCLFA